MHVKKEAQRETNFFTIKAALKTKLYQLRICKYKTTGISHIESHIGGHANNPLINISKTSKNSDLRNDKILNQYLDEVTVTPNELHEEHWGAYHSDEDMERNMCKATQDAQISERKTIYNESRFLRSSKLHRAIPLKRSSVQIKITGKRHVNK